MSSIQEDMKWADEHYIQLQDQYPDMWVAIHDKKIIAYHEEAGAARRKAIEKLGEGKDFLMEYVLSGELFVF
ncbi:MAG: DUF5678 domain-containing protein [Methanosarcinales archaeon]